jgi:hypothetical protein
MCILHSCAHTRCRCLSLVRITSPTRLICRAAQWTSATRRERDYLKDAAHATTTLNALASAHVLNLTTQDLYPGVVYLAHYVLVMHVLDFVAACRAACNAGEKWGLPSNSVPVGFSLKSIGCIGGVSYYYVCICTALMYFTMHCIRLYRIRMCGTLSAQFVNLPGVVWSLEPWRFDPDADCPNGCACSGG